MLQRLLTGDLVLFFWPQSVENRAALRTAFAALIAVLISFAFHLETPYWSGMSVVVVANLYTGSIIDKATMRIIGTIAGAFIGYFVAGLVVNSFLLYLFSCFLIIVIAVYYYNLSAYGYAYLLGALCAFIIISQLAINPQNAFFVAIWRPVEIGIGVLVSALSAYVIFPNHLKDNINVQVHDIFDDFSAEFKQLSGSLLQGKMDFNTVTQSNLKIKKKIRKAVELIGAMNHEIGVTKEKTDELRAFLDAFYNLSRQLQYLNLSSPTPEDLSSIQSMPIEPVFAAIQHDLALLQSAFTGQSSITMVLQTTEAIATLEKHFSQEKRGYLVKSDFVYSFIHFLQQISQCFSSMHALLVGSPVNKPKFQFINRQQRLRSDYDLIKHSIKAGVSVILALSFWLVSNWPGGLNGIISSLIISIRKNLYDMTNISIYRFIGCFLGGGVALFSLFILEMNLFELIMILFFFVWGFSYFMFKYPKYAYIGLQANIALIISLAQEGGPPVLLDPPLQRLAGIIIGIVASFIVANILWRSDVWTILNRYLNKLYNYMTFNLQQILTVSEGTLSLHDLANLFWVSRGIMEALADEHLSPNKQNRLTELTHRFESLVFIQATISHILVTIDREKAHATAELFNLNLPLYEQQLVVLFEHHDKAGGEALNHQLQVFLDGIEQHSSYSKVDDNDLRNLFAYINALNHLALRIQ
ncbi:FUSC family protein [Legionella maioricensis]|uniref:FUSC family protein n=1 Tax=Legionella maioricensis TaxID=2896528 RepID=A0A9X2IAP8_9GAMM|nr:FUSC family protein [Legionella maioricensis]MCL9687235.1 FUSC family protein [Legionella maioricensis]